MAPGASPSVAVAPRANGLRTLWPPALVLAGRGRALSRVRDTVRERLGDDAAGAERAWGRGWPADGKHCGNNGTKGALFDRRYVRRGQIYLRRFIASGLCSEWHGG